MKKITILVLSAALLLSLCACGGKKNTLFAEASPESSALELQWFDVTAGESRILYDTASEKEILAELEKVRAKKVEDWSPEKVTYPAFGLWIGSEDGEGVQCAWCDGYLLMRDGSVYEFDYDFYALAENYDWEYLRDIDSAAELYCGRFLAEGGGKWHPIHMTPAAEKIPPEGISMTLTEANRENLTAELTNASGESWCYGEYFSLEALLGDTWYAVPTTPEHNWGFTDIGLILEPGQTREETYNLLMYGELPAGTYRLVVEGLTAEFELE